MAVTSRPIEDTRLRARHRLGADASRALANRPDIAADEEAQAEDEGRHDADEGPGELITRTFRLEQHGDAEQEGDDTPDAHHESRAEGLDREKRDAEKHQGEAGVIDGQEVEGVKPEKKADRADRSRRDHAGRRELEDQAVDTDQHQDQRDVGIGDHRKQANEPPWLEQLDRQPLGGQDLLLSRHIDLAPVDLVEKLRGILRQKLDHMRFERRACRKARSLADGVFRPIGVAPTQLGKAPDEGDRVIGGLGRQGVARAGRGRAVLLFRARLGMGGRKADVDRRGGAKIGARRHGGDMRRI